MSDVWAAPGSAPDDGPRPAAAAPVGPAAPSPRGPSRSVESSVPPLPAAFRPLTLLEVLDGGVEAVRRSPASLLGVTALFVAPYALLVAWYQRGILGESFGPITTPLASGLAEDSGLGPGSTLQLLLGPLTHTFAAAGVARILLGWYRGTATSFGEVLAWLARRSWVLLVVWAAVRVLGLVGLAALCVGVLASMTFCLVAVPVVAAEDAGPFRAIARSFELTRRRWWASLGFALLSGFVALLLGAVLGALPQAVAFAVGEDALWILVGLTAVATSTFTTAMVGAATALWYLDLLVRTDGIDLEPPVVRP
jgi:hypothetical protein